MFGKLKQAMGIGTVKVELEIPTSVEKTGTTFSGTVRLTAQSDQAIQDISIRLIEKYSTGRGTEKHISEFDLGKIKLSDKFQMKSDEVKTITFTLPYKVRKSGNDQLREYGGVLGTLGKLEAVIEAETSTYHVLAAVSLKGAVFSPMDTKDIMLA